jgi:hypothetical protein
VINLINSVLSLGRLAKLGQQRPHLHEEVEGSALNSSSAAPHDAADPIMEHAPHESAQQNDGSHGTALELHNHGTERIMEDAYANSGAGHHQNASGVEQWEDVDALEDHTLIQLAAVDAALTLPGDMLQHADHPGPAWHVLRQHETAMPASSDLVFIYETGSAEEHASSQHCARAEDDDELLAMLAAIDIGPRRGNSTGIDKDGPSAEVEDFGSANGDPGQGPEGLPGAGGRAPMGGELASLRRHISAAIARIRSLEAEKAAVARQLAAAPSCTRIEVCQGNLARGSRTFQPYFG